jgi:hypothetical protein
VGSVLSCRYPLGRCIPHLTSAQQRSRQQLSRGLQAAVQRRARAVPAANAPGQIQRETGESG